MRPDTMDPTKPNKHARHNAEGRLSRPGEEYPWEDLETTDMFRPFFRLEQSRNPATGGVGLGLSIARDVVRNHGGDLTLEDAPGGGLRARIWLPV